MNGHLVMPLEQSTVEVLATWLMHRCSILRSRGLHADMPGQCPRRGYASVPYVHAVDQSGENIKASDIV